MHTVFGISFGDFPTLGTDVRQMSLARAAGFEATELSLGGENFEGRMEAAKAAGVAVSSVRLPPDYANLIWEDSSLWEQLHTLYSGCLSAAVSYGFHSVHMTVSTGVRPPVITQKGLENLRTFAKEAETAGVHLLLENTESMEHFEMAVRNICLGYHGVAFRPSIAFFSTGSSAVPSYARAHVKAVVFDDYVHGKDGYIPFDGETDFAPFAASLAQNPYHGVFLARLNATRGSYVGMRYESFAARAYENLAKISRMCRDEEGVI